MDIPCKAIVDLDFIFKHSTSLGIVDANNPDYLACKGLMQTIAIDPNNRIILGDDGWPKSGDGFITPEAAFELLANQPSSMPHIDNLHDLYKASNIWVWKKGAIEKYLGITNKNITAWSNFCNRLNNERYQDVIAESEKVLECINWLLS
jgi:hypothetical protein